MADVEYEVESITDKRRQNGRTEYYVKWKGYLTCESTWEPIEHLANARKAIEKYEGLEKSVKKSSSKPAPKENQWGKIQKICPPKERKCPRRIRRTRAAAKKLTVAQPGESGFKRDLMPERIVCSIDDGSTSTDTADEEYYEIEKIVDKRKREGLTEYCIKWKGYLDSENTWEPVWHLENVEAAVKKFERFRKLVRKSFSKPAKNKRKKYVRRKKAEKEKPKKSLAGSCHSSPAKKELPKKSLQGSGLSSQAQEEPQKSLGGSCHSSPAKEELPKKGHSSREQNEEPKKSLRGSCHLSPAKEEEPKKSRRGSCHSSAAKKEKPKKSLRDSCHSSAAKKEKPKKSLRDSSHSSAAKKEKPKISLRDSSHSSAAKKEKPKKSLRDSSHSSAAKKEKAKISLRDSCHSSAAKKEKPKKSLRDSCHSSAVKKEKPRKSLRDSYHSNAKEIPGEKIQKISPPATKQRKWPPGRIRRSRSAGTRKATVAQPTIGSGFERGLMPEKILCAINDGSSTRFLIKWLFEDELEIVEGDVAWANCPHLISDFYRPNRGNLRRGSCPPFSV